MVGIRLERQPPKQLEHLVDINDLRIAGELELPLSYLLFCWELPGHCWQRQICEKNRVYRFDLLSPQSGY